jgi:hypothetical protein
LAVRRLGVRQPLAPGVDPHREQGAEEMKANDFAFLVRNAELDQMLAGLSSLAAASWSYYEELIRVGFTEAQAFELMKAWQAGLFGLAQNGK